MTVRTVCNQTVRSNKRSVVCSAIEINVLETVFVGENHPNQLSFDSAGDVDIFYPGYEHIPCGSPQWVEGTPT